MSLREKILIVMVAAILTMSMIFAIRQHIAIYGLFYFMTNFIRG